MLQPIQRVGVAQETYERLRDAIFRGQFPPGERLDVLRLCQLFDVSKTPVKEAVSRLQLEGLVEIKARSGTFIRKVTIKDVHNLLAVRSMMEIFALEHVGSINPRRIKDLNDYVDEMESLIRSGPFDFPKYNLSDMKFHETLIALADNPELLRSYRALHSHYVTALGFYLWPERKARSGDKDHRSIVTAIKEGQFDVAKAIAQRHIQEAAMELAECLAGTEG